MTTSDGSPRQRRKGREIVIPTQALMLRFRIELQDTDPLVWRLIDVPGTYTFWDLHVAIQDAMGWWDYHLHEWTISHPRTGNERRFGLNDPRSDSDDPPGWAHQVATMFTFKNPTAHYLYDFGDDWHHTVTLVDVLRREKRQKYPRCVGGARACPPEDCGGTTGYAEIVSGNMDDDTRNWLPRGYDPATFDPTKVRFTDPHVRLAYYWYGDTEEQGS